VGKRAEVFLYDGVRMIAFCVRDLCVGVSVLLVEPTWEWF